jgi:hypothetical protein
VIDIARGEFAVRESAEFQENAAASPMPGARRLNALLDELTDESGQAFSRAPRRDAHALVQLGIEGDRNDVP